MKLEEDEILGQFFNTPEKRAKWMRRIVYIYLIWLIFLIVGLTIVLFYYLKL